MVQKQSQDDQDKNDKKKSKEKSWRNMKYTLIIFGVTFGVSGLYLIFELGRPKYDTDGLEIIDEYSGRPWYKQYIQRTLGELDYYGQVRLLTLYRYILTDLFVVVTKRTIAAKIVTRYSESPYVPPAIHINPRIHRRNRASGLDV